MSELEIREFEIREVNEEERTVSGLAVPYNQTIRVGDMQERVEKGAFAEVSQGVQLFYGHDHRTGGLPIGKVVEAREDDDGLHIKAKFSETAKADEVRTLVRDGVLSKFSVGFKPVKSRKDNGVIVREKGDLKEVSIVAIPAYANASVTEVRDDSNNNKENEIMSENELAPIVEELREQVSDVERRMAQYAEGVSEKKEETASQFRTAGEFAKSLVADPEAARMEMRAYTGQTLAADDDATRPAWLNAQLKLVAEKRPIHNLFRKAALPATGMSYQYPVTTLAEGTVTEHLEGADLPYTRVQVGSKTADIKVYGGYTSLSREVIERSEVAFLDLAIRNLFNRYAAATEKAVRDAFFGATGVQTATLGGDTAGDWLDVVLEGSAKVEDNAEGPVAEVVVVSRDVFRRMATMVDTAGRPLFVVNGDGSNSIGNVNVRGFAGSIAGFPVLVLATLPANTFYMLSSEAITIREDATKSLQDENIINLTKDFSVYGYLAVEVNNPLAIVRVDADLV